MKKLLCSTFTLLFIVTLIPFTADIAEAGGAVTTWGAIRDGDSGDGAAKAAPARIFGRRENVWDGLRKADAPSGGGAQSQDWTDILAEIGSSLDRDTLAELTDAPKAGVDVEFLDINGNPITQIKKGNPIQVFATHTGVDPFKGTCILVLPVNDPIYKEIMLQLRQYQGGVGGEWYPFYIPGWSQIEGRAIAIVIVDGAGTGFGFLDVLP